jgi:hypothetical protein
MKNIPALLDCIEDFAAILYALIQSDGTVSEIERRKFDTFFAEEFALDSSRIDLLFEAAASVTDIDDHLARLREGFGGHAAYLLRFMEYLNETILSDGIGDGEYALFEKVRAGLV